MRVVALAGGVGAGRFLRGLVRVIAPDDVTVIVNTGDDIELHGLQVSPDLDSVMYWLAGVSDRERGWGRAEESFRTLDEVGRLEGDAWFSLGDLDLATHLVRTSLLRRGRSLAEATAHLSRGFGVRSTILPMSNERVTTRIDAADQSGASLDLHFQEYWVRRAGNDEVKGVRYEGGSAARPAPGVLDAIADADAVLLCPSNPVVSIRPILSVPGIADAVSRRRDRGAAVTPILAGAPVHGMADRLMPAAGIEVSAAGVARAYGRLVAAFVLDQRDVGLRSRIEEETGMRVATIDTLMVDDAAAERVARAALELAAE